MKPHQLTDPLLQDGPVQRSFRKLEMWLEERRWSLEWSWKFDDHVDFSSMKIVLNRRRTLQSQLSGLLHEIGHILLTEKFDYFTRFPASDDYKRRQERKHETLKVRAEVLGEEWEAWCLGESFARQMGLEIDYDAFRASRNRDIKSYASWLLE